MAKQIFTTGQVLTANDMTSLQQTAMGGGSATAKTASYTLVAADAGTTVIMNSASATTITVNTALFAAGDTIFIVNQGAGICTITAGTATISTAGSLALSVSESGQLYFLSTSAAIFTNYTPASSSGPTFSAESNTEQNISASTNTKVTFQVENWDSDSAFASSRFTPQKAGYYQVNAIISFTNNANTTSRTLIFKNGSSYNPGGVSLGPAIANPTLAVSALVDLNGTTDYIELFGFNDAASGTRQFYRSFFNAVWIRSL